MSRKKIAVSNISKHLQKSHLRELFECCGEIISLELTVNIKNERVCMIEFANPAHADAASMLTGTPLGDKSLVVEVITDTVSSIPKNSNQGIGQQTVSKAINQSVVNGMNTNQMLQVQHMALQNMQSMQMQAFLAQQVQLMNSIPQPVSTGIPSVANQKHMDELARTVYVGNLSATTTQAMLSKFFSAVGKVLYMKVLNENSAISKYAFIEFSSIESAQKAMKLSGSTLGGQLIKVGKASNPIYKTPVPTEEEKIEAAMEKVRRATEAIDKRINREDKDDKEEKRKKERSNSQTCNRNYDSHRSRSRYTDRNRRDRGRDRGRDRDRDRYGSRYRDRDSGRERRRYGGRSRYRRSRSKSKSRSKSRSRSRNREKNEKRERNEKNEKKNIMEGYFWDGFRWRLPPTFVSTSDATNSSQSQTVQGSDQTEVPVPT